MTAKKSETVIEANSLAELIQALETISAVSPRASVCFATHPGSHIIETMPLRIRLARAWPLGAGRYSTLGPDAKELVVIIEETPNPELAR